MLKIAVLMTCYNRRIKTLSCLDALSTAVNVANIEMSIFLLDDGSPDGTGDAVLARYPQTNLFRGSGCMFWNRGMHCVMTEAMKADFDYCLWLNDDTILYEHSLKTLLCAARWAEEQFSESAIIVGATESKSEPGIPTYGGLVRNSRLRPLRFELVAPNEVAQPCDTMNGNCVLISRDIIEKIGLLDPIFRHSMGDTDYGFRASKRGIKIFVAPNYVGTCEKNPATGEWVDPAVPVQKRLRQVISPKALPPLSWAVYTYRHAGVLWPIVCVWPYLNILRTSLLRRFKARGR